MDNNTLIKIERYVLIIVSDLVRSFIGSEGKITRGPNWTAEHHIEWIVKYCLAQADLTLLCDAEHMWYVKQFATAEASKWLKVLQEC